MVDEISQFLYRQELYKTKIGLGTTLTTRRDDKRKNQKASRNNLLNNKRNIGNLSPFVTPGIQRRQQPQTMNEDLDKKRYEQLQKYKAQKLKEKELAKTKAKPIFKVCAVSNNYKSNFAPINHKFQAPKNLKPVTDTKPAKTQLKPTKSKVRSEKVSADSVCGETTIRRTRARIYTTTSKEESPPKKPKITPKRKSLHKPDKKVLTTPKNNMSEGKSSESVYVSPFVTVSRGKSSARKEVSEDLRMRITGANYFTEKLDGEISRIEATCVDWDRLKCENELAEEAVDLIDVYIGQSRLLIAKKFEQFRGLIEECRNESPKVTCKDLHGFWDLIYIQVENLNSRQANLLRLKANNWEEILFDKIEVAKKVVVKKTKAKPAKKKAAAGSSSLAKMIREAKQKKLEEVKKFEGGYFTIDSPVKVVKKTPRRSVLPSEAKKRISSSGLVVMRVSQTFKNTPTKSILKTQMARSEPRLIKSVLFKEEDDKENVEGDLEAKTPLRRSSRRSIRRML